VQNPKGSGSWISIWKDKSGPTGETKPTYFIAINTWGIEDAHMNSSPSALYKPSSISTYSHTAWPGRDICDLFSGSMLYILLKNSFEV